MAEKKPKTIAFRWIDPRTDSDWIQWDNGHLSCIRLGQFKEGVEVRCRWGYLRKRVGHVRCLMPTHGPWVMIIVTWELQPGDIPPRVPWFHSDDLLIVITNERAG